MYCSIHVNQRLKNKCSKQKEASLKINERRFVISERCLCGYVMVSENSPVMWETAVRGI